VRADPRRRRSLRQAILLLAAAVTVAAVVGATGPAGAQPTGTPSPVRIGALLSITGVGSSLGNASNAALEVAKDRWNRRLAAQHRAERVDLTVVDTGQDPARAATGFQQLADQGVRVVIGPQSSSEVAAIQAAANARGVLVVSQGSTASSLAMPNNNVFRFVPNDHVEGRATTDLVVRNGAKIVVPLWRNDRGNQGLADSVRAAASAAGTQVTAGFRYDTTTTDFGPALAEISRQVSAAVQQVGAAHVAVYHAGFEEVAGLFAAAGQVPGLASVRWYGGDSSANTTQLLQPASARFATAVGGDPSPLVALPAGRARRDAALIGQIARRAHATPDAFSLAAYDAFDVAVQTLLRTGPAVDGQTLRTTFARTANGYQGVTGTIQLDANGDRASAPYAYWSICRGRATRPRWATTGTWTPNATDPTGPGQATGGNC
jgi:branched-chain amino acid transport system substrate-binding protein